jgi:hypothetical protein
MKEKVHSLSFWGIFPPIVSENSGQIDPKKRNRIIFGRCISTVFGAILPLDASSLGLGL